MNGLIQDIVIHIPQQINRFDCYPATCESVVTDSAPCGGANMPV
tara:strand:- start:151 stop:282 length:132 start_codon:yes stop_codon:yes gene_type:complete